MQKRTHSPWVEMYYRRPKQELRTQVTKLRGQCDDVEGCAGNQSHSIIDAVQKNRQLRDRQLIKTHDMVRNWLTASPLRGLEAPVGPHLLTHGGDSIEVACFF